MTKQTAAEWKDYIDALSTDELVDVTQNANSVGFVRALQEEGYEVQEIHDILVLFAKRWRKLGQVPPPGGYVDLEWLADNP